MGVLGALLAALCATVGADIPVHCLRHEVEGQWVFRLSEPTATRSSCGHQRPDSQNEEPRALAEADVTDASQKRVTLTGPDHAVTAADPRGTFTMIYDEGFEVRVEDHVFFAFSRFDWEDEAARSGNKTDCSRTLVGWYEDVSQGAETPRYGCYIGEQEDHSAGAGGRVSLSPTSTRESREQAEQETSEASFDLFNGLLRSSNRAEQSLSGESEAADIVTDSRSTDAPRVNPYAAFLTDAETPLNADVQRRAVDSLNLMEESTWTARSYDQYNGLSARQLNGKAGIKRGMSLKHAARHVRRSAKRKSPVQQMQAVLAAAAASGGSSDAATGVFVQLRGEVPDSWDWREQGVLDPVSNQGDCGSCYAVASTSMLSARRRVKFGKHLPRLSTAFGLQCAEYNQGCDGGYAFLFSKWSSDVGVVDANCFPYARKDGGCRQVDRDCALNSGGYRATNHRYIGGYYGGSDEDEMLMELYHNGPIVVSFEPADSFMYYSKGIYKSGPTKIHAEWQQVDHAVLAVGFGEENGQQYWTVMNSWGDDWGEQGFFRIARGVNDSGIESITVAADIEQGSTERLAAFLGSLQSFS